MSAQQIEKVLARLYVDDEARERFLREPRVYAREMGLDAEQSDALAGIDQVGLTMAARSFAAKRATRTRRRNPVLSRLAGLVRRALSP